MNLDHLPVMIFETCTYAAPSRENRTECEVIVRSMVVSMKEV